VASNSPESVASAEWYRDFALLERLTERGAPALGEDYLAECRVYLRYLREHEDAHGLLPVSFAALVQEIFGPLVAPPESRPAAPVVERRRVAVLVACKNGAATIARTVRSAADQADVYVVSDGSTDDTVDEAIRAGARVLMRDVSGGKPDSLRLAMALFELAPSYEYIAVLDDDTTIEPGYLDRLIERMDADPGIAVASGRIKSHWDHVHRWNVLIAMRAFMYWSYQTTMKRGQNALRAVNVICGANSVFRASVFAELSQHDAPYAVDDMFWVAEISRRKIGRVEYVHDVTAWTIDPHRFRDWYRQTVRWSWGQFQSIRGHRLGLPVQRKPGSRFGLSFSWFDAAYLLVMLDWLGYAVEPIVLGMTWFFLRGWIDPLWFVIYYVGANCLWITVAAAALRKPRLIALAPALLLLDFVYRVTMVHAAVKTVLQPRIATCRWDSPPRFDLQ
jgi:poly-beta-1,6-N-acetyl-D-glucosamine synthase